MSGVIRDFNKLNNWINNLYNSARTADKKPDDLSETDKKNWINQFNTKYAPVLAKDQSQIDAMRINYFQRLPEGTLNKDLEDFRGFLRNAVQSNPNALNNQNSQKLQDENYAGGFRNALSRNDQNVKTFFGIQDKQDGVGQTFNVNGHDLMKAAESQLKDVVTVGRNSNERGQILAREFYTNADSSGMATMRLPEMIAAMNYAKTLGGEEGEKFKTGFFKGMANFIKQNRGFTPAQFMNTMANVYNNYDWGGADINGKDETSRNLAHLKDFLGEMTGGIAKEFGFKKGIIGGYDDGVRGATALVLGDDGKAQFETVREGSVLTKSRLLWDGDNQNITLTSAKAAPTDGQGAGTRQNITGFQDQLAEAERLVKDPNAEPLAMLKVLTSLGQSMSAALSGVNLGDPKAVQGAIDLLESQVAGLDEKNPARALLTAQIDSLKASLADVKPVAPKVEKSSSWKPKDVNEAKANPDKLGTRLFIEDENYNPTKEDSKFARQNPDTLFAIGVAYNPNYTPTQEDIEVARKNPDARFAYILDNSNYTPTQEDIEVARKNPDSTVAMVLSDNADKSNYNPTQDDINVVRKNPDSYFAKIVAQNRNYNPTQDDIDFVKRNPNTYFANRVAQNRNYNPTQDDIDFAKKNPYTEFADGLARREEALAKLSS